MTDDFEKKCKIVENAEFGRYVVAAMPLKAGETILVEQPTFIVPVTGEQRCTKCHKLTTKFCSKCQLFPLCEVCLEHDAADCTQLAEYGGNVNIPLLQKHQNIYLALKCLLLRTHSLEQYKTMLELEAHMEQRRDSEIWTQCQEKVVQPLREAGMLSQIKVDNNEEDDAKAAEQMLQQWYSIADVNIYEIRAPEPALSMRGLYCRGALFAHSCMPNIVTAIDPEYRLKVYVNRYIAEGETLYNSYTNVLLGTEERRRILLEGKYFHCRCTRCLDPTELGTHMSSFICAQCASSGDAIDCGYIVKQADTGFWQCLVTPEHTLKAEYVANVLERAKEEIFHARDDIYRQELLLAKLGRILHRNHYLILDLKQNIAAFLRQVLQNMSQRPSSKVYERKIRLCQEILLVLKDIQPGISRLKAIALYELCTTQAELGRKLYGENIYTAQELLAQLQQTEYMLRESLRMLLYEPLNTPEGQLTRSMLKELKDLQNDMKILQLEPNK